MKDRKEIDVDDLLGYSNEASSKMLTIFDNILKKSEFSNDEAIKQLQNKLKEIQDKR